MRPIVEDRPLSRARSARRLGSRPHCVRRGEQKCRPAPLPDNVGPHPRTICGADEYPPQN